METIHSNLKTLQDNYNIELENTQQLSKILAQKEIELTEVCIHDSFLFKFIRKTIFILEQKYFVRCTERSSAK